MLQMEKKIREEKKKSTLYLSQRPWFGDNEQFHNSNIPGLKSAVGDVAAGWYGSWLLCMGFTVVCMSAVVHTKQWQT